MSLTDDELIERMEINELRRSYTLRPLDSSDEEAKRTCLSCNKFFESEWAGNRICPRCTERNAELGPYAEYATASDATLEDYVAEYSSGYTKKDESYKEKHQRITDRKHITKKMMIDNSKPEYLNIHGRGIVIQNTAALPGPCDIQPLWDDALRLRSALQRKHLQAFHVEKELTQGQFTELIEALNNGRSWVLISPHIQIDTELFSDRVLTK